MTETGPNLTNCNRNRQLQLTRLYDLSVAGFTLCQKKHDREKPVITGCDRFFLPNTYIIYIIILYCNMVEEVDENIDSVVLLPIQESERLWAAQAILFSKKGNYCLSFSPVRFTQATSTSPRTQKASPFNQISLPGSSGLLLAISMSQWSRKEEGC